MPKHYMSPMGQYEDEEDEYPYGEEEEEEGYGYPGLAAQSAAPSAEMGAEMGAPMGAEEGYGEPMGIMAELQDLYGQEDWTADPEFNTGAPMPLGGGMGPAGSDSMAAEEYDPEAIKADLSALLLQRAQERQAASDEFQRRAVAAKKAR